MHETRMNIITTEWGAQQEDRQKMSVLQNMHNRETALCKLGTITSEIYLVNF